MGRNDIHLQTKSVGFLKEIARALVSILLALLAGSLIIILTGESPIEAYAALIKGAFGNQTSTANTVSKAIPLVFTGLSVALSARCGMLNIGAEGQLNLGAMASALIALTLVNTSAYIALPLCIAAGFLGGMLGGLAAGVMKSRFEVNEVIAAIMLNYVFRMTTSWLAAVPFSSRESMVQTPLMPENTWLPTLVSRSKLTAALYLALAAVLILYVFLWKTRSGFKLRAVGYNRTAALSAGINAGKYMAITMALAGGFAGLAGATEVMGKYHRFIENFSPSFGFTGIAVAILGRNHPAGVVLTAFLFAVLDTGSLRMARVTNVSGDMVIVIQSLIILAVAAPGMLSFSKRRGRP